MPTNPLVFISYAQFDDEFEGGALRRFRDALSGTLRFVSGNDVAVFQEGTDVAIGEPIQERISQSLNEAMVLVPVITPSFFTDPNCREILARFLERERQLGRNDLVPAVYYQQVAGLKDAEAQANDELLRNLARRHMLDWQPLRGKDFKDPQVKFAKIIRTALPESRLQPVNGRRPAEAGTPTPGPGWSACHPATFHVRTRRNAPMQAKPDLTATPPPATAHPAVGCIRCTVLAAHHTVHQAVPGQHHRLKAALPGAT